MSGTEHLSLIYEVPGSPCMCQHFSTVSNTRFHFRVFNSKFYHVETGPFLILPFLNPFFWNDFHKAPRKTVNFVSKSALHLFQVFVRAVFCDCLLKWLCVYVHTGIFLKLSVQFTQMLHLTHFSLELHVPVVLLVLWHVCSYEAHPLHISIKVNILCFSAFSKAQQMAATFTNCAE